MATVSNTLKRNSPRFHCVLEVPPQNSEIGAASLVEVQPKPIQIARKNQLQRETPPEVVTLARAPGRLELFHSPQLRPTFLRGPHLSKQERILPLSRFLERKENQEFRMEINPAVGTKTSRNRGQSQICPLFRQNTIGHSPAGENLENFFNGLSESSVVLDSRENTAGRVPSGIAPGRFAKRNSGFAGYLRSTHPKGFQSGEPDGSADCKDRGGFGPKAAPDASQQIPETGFPRKKQNKLIRTASSGIPVHREKRNSQVPIEAAARNRSAKKTLDFGSSLQPAQTASPPWRVVSKPVHWLENLAWKAPEGQDRTAQVSPIHSRTSLFQPGLPSLSSISNKPSTPSICQSARQILLSCSPRTTIHVTQRRRPALDRQRLLPLLSKNFTSTPDRGLIPDLE